MTLQEEIDEWNAKQTAKLQGRQRIGSRDGFDCSVWLAVPVLMICLPLAYIICSILRVVDKVKERFNAK